MFEAVQVVGMYSILVLMLFPWLFLGTIITVVAANTTKAIVAGIAVALIVNSGWLNLFGEWSRYNTLFGVMELVFQGFCAVTSGAFIAWVIRRVRGRSVDLSVSDENDVRYKLRRE